MRKVKCSYCGNKAEYVNRKEIYNIASKHIGMVWVCRLCKAWVGCHKGTNRPLGTLAKYDLRRWREKAHDALDKKWNKGNNRSRNQTYKRLAKHLGIKKKDCHIGKFDIETCKKVIGVCSWYL